MSTSLSANIIGILGFCIVATPAFAQNKNTAAALASRQVQEAKIDSMRNQMAKLPADSAVARANYLHKISLAYKIFNRDSAMACLMRANTLLEKQPLSQTKANIVYQLAQTNLNNGNMADAISYCEKALGLYTALNLPHRIGNTHNTMAACYAYQGKAPEAIAHFRATLTFWDSVKYAEDYASVLGNIGAVYAQMLEDNASSINYFTRGMKILEADNKTNPSEALGIAYMNIGSAMLNEKRMEEAKGYYAKALVTYRALNMPMDVARTSLLLSGLYAGEKQPEKAEQLFKDANAALTSLEPDYALQATIVLTEGSLRRAQHRYKDALAAHARGLAFAQQNGDIQLQASYLEEYEITYKKKGNFIKSRKYHRQAAALNAQMQNSDVQEQVDEMEKPAPRSNQ